MKLIKITKSESIRDKMIQEKYEEFLNFLDLEQKIQNYKIN